MTRLIKATRNIRIYRPCVFHMRSEPKQSYSPEFDCDNISPYSTWKWKGITYESIKIKINRLN